MATELTRSSGVAKVGRYPLSVVDDGVDGVNLIDDLKIGRPQPVVWQPHTVALEPRYKPSHPADSGDLTKAAARGDIALQTQGLGVFNGRVFSTPIPERIFFFDNFRQLPLLNTSVLITATDPTLAEMALRFRANRDWELAGADVIEGATFATDGGLTLTTDTGDADQLIIVPHSDTNQSSIKAIPFLSQKRPLLETRFNLVSVAACKAFMGFRLTHPDPWDIATDDDKLIVWFDTDVDGYLHYTYSIAGTDTSGILTDKDGDNITVTAAADYVIQMGLDDNRYPYIMVNNDLCIAPAVALTTAISLLPHIGIETATTAAKAMDVRYLAVSRDY